jgi:hypothetical protein
MADPTSHPDFDLDTAVSASLDDELDGYAAELGVEPDELRTALTTPDAMARRAELAAVRRTLAEEPEPSLDDVTRRRLLASAGVGGSREQPRRDRSRLLQAGVAAAVTLVVLGAIYAITRDTGGSGGSAAKSSASGGATAAAVTGDVGELGTVDPRVVAKLLHGERPSTEGTGGSSFAQDAPAQSTARNQAGTAKTNAQQVDACATQYATEGTIRFRGSGSYGVRPAVVLGIDAGKRTIVFVVAADDCAQVLYSASR